MRRSTSLLPRSTRFGLLVISSASLSFQGCGGDPTLQRLSSELATTGQQAPSKVQAFYEKLNVEHHKMDAEELRFKGVPELDGIDIPQPGRFAAKFDPDEVVRPRVKMAELFAAYCTEIDKIANAKNIFQADQVVSGLNGTVQKIGADLLGIQSIASKLPITAITALAQPVKTLTGLGIQGAFAFIRENWAKDTINRIDGAFEQVCDDMQLDLDNSAKDAKERAINISDLKNRIYQNKVKKGISEDEKNKLSTEVMQAGTYCDTVASGNPKEVFEKAKKTMHLLADWAKERVKAQSKFTKFFKIKH